METGTANIDSSYATLPVISEDGKLTYGNNMSGLFAAEKFHACEWDYSNIYDHCGKYLHRITTCMFFS